MPFFLTVLFSALLQMGSARGADTSNKDSVPSAKDLQKTTLYREAQQHFRRKNYAEAARIFGQFLEKEKKDRSPFVRERVFWSIDLIVRIHLRVRKNPDAALDFLKHVRKGLSLNEAQEDSIDEWVSVAKQWKKMGKLPANIKTKKELFALGEKFYRRGMSKISYPSDDTGNADFYIAATYLVPFVYNFEGSENIGKALFMLGNIRFRSWTDYEYWTENFYLKEVIRRFPHSSLAKRAYKSLEESLRAGYTGSSGENIPPSQLKMLEVYKKLSQPSKPPKPLVF